MIGVLRYLIRSINLLNVLLLAVLILFIVFVILPLSSATVRFKLPVMKAKAIEQPVGSADKPQNQSPADYAMIGENNLFHPERKVPPEKKDENALPKPELVLYGTIVSDGITMAFIEDKKSPRTSEARGKRQSVIKKGDILSGFMVKEIQPDMVLLTRGEETMTVKLSDDKKQREGAGMQGMTPNRPGAPPPAVRPLPTSAPPPPVPMTNAATINPATPGAPKVPPSFNRRSGRMPTRNIPATNSEGSPVITRQ
jgi:hypothetical protein